MKRDMVCGKQIDEQKAPASSFHDGERYVFCGQVCKDKFDQNPERYTKSSRKPERTPAPSMK
ncbi:MAG TPA: YHS domain-containing protein [Bryobacteraceae bacterium]|nr:YHS domain-containing protein [Bryobacteraceae bacterium]